MNTAAGLTLVEVMAATLVLTLAGFALMALVHVGLRDADVARMRAVGLATAGSMIVQPVPPGFQADLNDADGDGWERIGTMVRGPLHGMYVIRDAESIADPITPQERVTVDIYDSSGGRHLLRLRRTIVP